MSAEPTDRTERPATDSITVIHRQIAELVRHSRLRRDSMYGEMSFIAFATLSFVADADCAHAADLAAAYGIDKSIVSRQVRELREQGLLNKEPDPDHVRMQRLLLTADGHATLEQIRSWQRVGVRDAVDGWSDQDIVHFGALFERFVDHLRARSDDGG